MTFWRGEEVIQQCFLWILCIDNNRDKLGRYGGWMFFLLFVPKFFFLLCIISVVDSMVGRLTEARFQSSYRHFCLLITDCRLSPFGARRDGCHCVFCSLCHRHVPWGFTHINTQGFEAHLLRHELIQHKHPSFENDRPDFSMGLLREGWLI